MLAEIGPSPNQSSCVPLNKELNLKMPLAADFFLHRTFFGRIANKLKEVVQTSVVEEDVQELMDERYLLLQSIPRMREAGNLYPNHASAD
jgi:hypothetical protein